MKAEAAAFLDQADIVLVRADRMLSVGLNEDAARTAYLACFHVAQAHIRTYGESLEVQGCRIVWVYSEKAPDRR